MKSSEIRRSEKGSQIKERVIPVFAFHDDSGLFTPHLEDLLHNTHAEQREIFERGTNILKLLQHSSTHLSIHFLSSSYFCFQTSFDSFIFFIGIVSQPGYVETQRFLFNLFKELFFSVN